MNTENWKIIEGWEDYEVSTLGNFRRATPAQRARVGKEIKTFKNKKTGYLSVTLSGKNGSLTMLAHRLVAKNFIPNPENKREVDHINCDRSDNRVENLRWATSSENNRRFAGKKTTVKDLKTGEAKTFDTRGEALDYAGVSGGSLAYRLKKGLPLVFWNLEIILDR